jgi:hypothetical protein
VPRPAPSITARDTPARARRATCANGTERETRDACEEDAAEREKRAAMDVMFVAMVAVTTIVGHVYPRGAFGRDDELPRVL